MRYQKNGKLYDTDTAVRVLVAESEVARKNPRFYEQTLYRKRTGEFFLHCVGGPESPAARFTRPGQSKPEGGEFIQPVDAIGAREFVEERGGRAAADLLDRYFGEKPDEVKITAVIDRQADAMLRRLQETDPTVRSQGTVISKALRMYFQATRIDGVAHPLDADLRLIR
ncbi:hypothetical protein [uncultured Adlercreutzia sp.]|uniref:hypothetical protein n=1 Tax=uncultured Adlercreutzia sp. TaxID=875803 RepID=UPI0025FEE478|nr:hypothetical protein [uncultured Adlercreutzia sp.]